jgi:hypothetical protein
MTKNALKNHLVEGPVTYDFTLHLNILDHKDDVGACVGMAFGHFLLSSHNLMVTALGLCVKWPNVQGEPVFSVMAAGWFCEKSG